jgi:hypothetical protein
MAKHAMELGLDRDMVAFSLCGEINFGDTINQRSITQRLPMLETRSTRCSWNKAWEDEGVLEFGRLYCEEIDTAIAEGFNRDLDLSVKQTLSHGAPDCHFVYTGGRLGEEDERRLAELRETVGDRFLRTWSFHLADLYGALFDELRDSFAEAGAEAAAEALDEFEARFGSEAAEAVGQAATAGGD